MSAISMASFSDSIETPFLVRKSPGMELAFKIVISSVVGLKFQVSGQPTVDAFAGS